MRIFGASVRGPSHRVDGLPNQDAWAKAQVGEYLVAVVSDGMGSKPKADIGSRGACKAVVDAIRVWNRTVAAELDLLIALIHVMWRARISPTQPQDCACTCLLAAAHQNGGGFAAQLGDGAILLRGSSGVELVAPERKTGFTNETQALGVTAKVSAWRTRHFGRETCSVVLCTDGVAEDLLPSSYAAFTDWLVSDIGRLPAGARWGQLRRELGVWPTPGHTDDKTVAVMDLSRSAK